MSYIVITLILFALGYVFFKPHSPDSRRKMTETSLYEFLEKADDAYIMSHQKRCVDFLDRFATEEVVLTVLEDINYGTEKLFGTSKYRVREWEFIEKNEYSWVLRKSITHQHIRINRTFNIAIGEDMVEIWRVRRVGNSFRVVEIM